MCGNCHNITFRPTANYEANLIYNVSDVTKTAVRTLRQTEETKRHVTPLA
jgi:hypothetical protein